MNSLSGSRAGWAALGAIVGAFAVGGIAWADIPDSGVIHACSIKLNGQLRVIDTSKGQACGPSESALSWNQAGPKGATGATGATGPSDGFATGFGDFISQPLDDNGSTTFVSFSLPVGSYVLNADLRVAGDTNVSVVTVQCEIFLGVKGTGTYAFADVPPSTVVAVPIASAFTLSATTTVSAQCAAFSTGLRTGVSRMTATRVASLTVS